LYIFKTQFRIKIQKLKVNS